MKAVVFDLGGVVLTNDWDVHYIEFLEEFGDYFGMSVLDMNRGWKLNWSEFCVGKTTEEEFWKGFLDGAKPDVEAAEKIWRKHQHSLEGMLPLIKRLKGRRIAALTNIGREWIEYKRKKFGLDELFEIIVSSGYEGVAKPDPKIYKILLKRLGIPPGECLYVDDRARNLAPAKKLGMKTLLFLGQKDFEEKLVDIGITF